MQEIRDREPDRKLIWIDDDISGDVNARFWLEDEPNVFAVCPNSWTGFSDMEMEKIESWLN